ncbi:MAG: right-handed parallel beta-helix repeat-containing protein, partial [Brevinematia bacterium]
TISSSYIYNSYSEGYGGGIDIYRSSYVYILSSTITNCLADVDHNNYGSGGAISVSSSTNVTIKDNTLYDCGIPSISGANDSVISLYGSYNIPGLRIKNNYIRGVSLLSSYGIYEEVNITNHEVVDNNFYSSKLRYPYYDYANGSLNITSLNNGQAGTSIATNNTWN